MKILVVGAGGREHAVCWQFSKSPKVKRIYCAPGNDGISQVAQSVNIAADDFERLANFAKANGIGFTFVGSEFPLSLGIVDYFQQQNLKIFGPSRKAAKLESSKIYSKNFMKKYEIPTALYGSFSKINDALQFLKNCDTEKKIVVKADGLAAGKGVYVCNTREDAENVVKRMMVDKALGDAGSNVIIEEYIDGPELTYLIFTDGVSYSMMPAAQDHKRVNDNDQGPNTGGMGAYAPAALATKELNEKIKDILVKIINGIKSENLDYTGVLYVGVIINNSSPYVLEFNCRLGDPETQAVLPLLDTDLVDICMAVLSKNLSNMKIDWKNKFSVCVVLTSGGYPGNFKNGFEIKGLEKICDKDAILFHAGTKFHNKKFTTVGGRVLGVTSVADSIQDAVTKVYENINFIRFENMHYRTDIAWRAIDEKQN